MATYIKSPLFYELIINDFTNRNKNVDTYSIYEYNNLILKYKANILKSTYYIHIYIYMLLYCNL
jgi:hypothetical protein